MRQQLDAMFLIQIYLGSKFCPSLLETVDLRVPARYIRDIALLNAHFSSNNCPSTSYASAPNAVCRDADVLGTKTVFRNLIL
jgi:hypothetical protein